MNVSEIKPTMPIGLKDVKNIIAVGSGKGGVGKSTVTTLLAYGLRERGFRVGVLDADIYGPSQLHMMGRPDKNPAEHVDGQMAKPIEKNGISYISMAAFQQGDQAHILRAPMVVKWLQFFMAGVEWGDLDYLLIDLPPGTGDIQLTMAQQTYLNAAVIVSTANDVAIDVSRKGLAMFKQVNVPIAGVVENMSGFACAHCDEITHLYKGPGAEVLSTKANVPFLGKLPMHPAMTSTNDGFSDLIGKDNIITGIIKQLADKFIDSYQELQDIAKAEEPEQVEIRDGGEVYLKWVDGTERRLSARDLRISCSCASCVNEVTGEKILDPNTVPENLMALKGRQTGRYGVSIHFSDGHNTGIYRFKNLKEMANSESFPSTAGFAKAGATTETPANNLKQTDFLNEVRKLVAEKIAPSLAGHGGKMDVLDFTKEGQLIVNFGGGCQGCSQIDATLKGGVERILKDTFPEIMGVTDQTDHNSGENPYYT